MNATLQSTSEAFAAALAQRKPQLAVEIAHKSLLGPQDHSAIFAQVLQRSGFSSASEIGVNATQVIWRDYGSCLARAGLLEDSCLAFSIALELDPDCYQSLIDAGTAEFMLGRFGPAADDFKYAAKLNPKDPGPPSNLAAIYARQAKTKAARIYAKRALALDPLSITSNLALARADLIDGHPGKAENKISEQLRRTDITDQNRIALLDLRAEARDKSNDCKQAFFDYTERNALLIRDNEARVAQLRPEREIDNTLRISAFFRNHVSAWHDWHDLGDNLSPVRSHVFLVGFPRSGTTLVEKALAGHPDIVTLEEIESLHGISEQWTSDTARLTILTAETPDSVSEPALHASRAAYWHKVQAAAKLDLADKVVIDKMPLYSLQLPVIARLFPQAQILFARRDPRDVVLSCFRRRFRINPAMFEFLTLAGAARYYDAMMAHSQRCRALLPLSVHNMHHENIVENFDAEIAAILTFLGLQWHDAVRLFAGRAALRPVTPSDPQLVRGLNSDSIGQWRRYREALAPVRSVLDPWAAAYGYPLE